ncbi:expressed unknown protein [Seminavis robusta]|uniref:Uncharacterized protein n=1 Tax=Seminavis robusta TaxID=568900 RepID=A0A9N8HB58_9STRA|nr:expressed unknown protein [Seminavis robusta]|eukprot:Sro171_g075660.1 n/a (412) ;mRNA; f:13003-14238
MTNNGTKNKRQSSTDDEDQYDQQEQAVSSAPTRSLLSPHRVPIDLLLAGWNRLESVPRWMMERTLGFVVPTLQQHHHHSHSSNTSSMVRRVLEQHESSDEFNSLQVLKQKYAKEIRANAELQSMQKQIRALKQQLQQQRTQREKLEKKQAAWRDKEQKQLEHSTSKLHHALAQALGNNKTQYGKALSRAGNRKARTSTSASIVKKTVSKAAKAAADTLIAPEQPLTSEERDRIELETTILKTMHITMIFQNQCDITSTNSKQITSALKRERALLDTQQAQVAMMQMVLDGTQRALHDIYPEVILRQECLLDRLMSTSSKSSWMTPSIPRLIAPPPQQQLGVRTRSDGISDLGESIRPEPHDTTSSVGDYESIGSNNNCHQPMMYYGGGGPPVLTTVQALQQHTLQHMALAS